MDHPVECVFDELLLAINGLAYEVKPLVSLGTHPNLIVRRFHDDPYHAGSLYQRMREHTPGQVVDTHEQLSSYSRQGFCEHQAID